MKRESKLVILVFLLVVGPAVLLSLFAVRVLNNWQVVLQKRLETEAVRVLDQAESVFSVQFAVFSESEAPWVDGIFAFKPGVGLVYPPAESTNSSFIPPAVVPDSALRAAALLQQAAALRAAGKTNEAVEVLSKVAEITPHPGPLPQGERVQTHLLPGSSNLLPLPLRERAGVRGRSEDENSPRDPDEGFFYDLVALKLLGDVEESRRRVLARYDDLVPLQRDLMVEFIETSNHGQQSADPQAKNIEQKSRSPQSGENHLSAYGGKENFSFARFATSVHISSASLVAWRERMRARALTAGDRAKLAAEIAGVASSVLATGWIRTRIAGKDALVGRAQGSGFRVQGAAGVRSPESAMSEFVVLQFDEGKLIDHLNTLFATVTTNSGIRIKVSGFRVQGSGNKESEALPELSSLNPEPRTPIPPLDFSVLVLATRRLPSPLESITLEATPADPEAYLANARLQSRLYAVGGGVLLISVVAGVWLIWRQAAGEIKDARERTDFAATVSHDLRTPLASMRMLAESLYMGNVADNAKKQTFLGAILKESDRLSRLTDRALYFIRYGQGALRYQFTEGDLGSLVKDVVETFAVGIAANVEEKISPQRHRDTENTMFREFQAASTPPEIPETLLGGIPRERGDVKHTKPLLSLVSSFKKGFMIFAETVLRFRKNHETLYSPPLSSPCLCASVVNPSSPVVRLAMEPELPQVCFDDGAMEQVVFNLLDNAVKYSDKEKGVAIEVSVEARPRRTGLLRWRKAGGVEVVLSVKDHGMGMAPDEIRRVLKPYARGRGAAKQNARGIGLGLALCHHVVKAHGGRIEIESELGKGTTFSIILPAAT